MKTLAIVIVAAITLVAFTIASSGTASAEHPESEVQAMPYPSVTLNVTSSAFYNLTFLGMLLKTPQNNYVTDFNEQKWSFTKHNNTSYSYNSNVNFMPRPGNAAPSDSQDQGGQAAPITAMMDISLHALDYSVNNASIANQSTPAGKTVSFPNYSVLEITISMAFKQAVQGPGTLYLLQLIKSSNESKSAASYYMGNFTHNMRDRMHGEHRGLFIPANKTQISAFYWWNNTFDLNGASKNLTSQVGLKDGGIYIVFAFPFNNTLTTIFQDPYIGVPGNPLFKNPIIQKDIGKIVNYLVIHAEFLGTGVASGLGILGISYSMYRRRRF